MIVVVKCRGEEAGNMLLRRTRRSTHSNCGALVNVHDDAHRGCLGKGKSRFTLLCDDVPTLGSHRVCLDSLRVVSPGVQRRKSTRKDPVTQTESLVLTRLPPRTAADSVSIQWSSEVKP